MTGTGRFAVRTLLITLVTIGLLLGVVQYLTSGNFTMDRQALTMYGVGAVFALVLWRLIQAVARGAFNNTGDTVGSHSPAVEEVMPEPVVDPVPPPVEAAPTVEPSKLIETGAAQILAILQRKGRLIDFLQEDLSQFEDAQIGAAVRNIHEECKAALNESLTLESVYTDAEGSTIKVPAGFDAQSVRLTGNVRGEPPFTGTLRHRGWRVSAFNLPQRTGNQDSHVIAAAEVEVNA